MSPQELRDMAAHYRKDRPSVDQDKRSPMTQEISDRECNMIAEALENAADQIDSALKIRQAIGTILLAAKAPTENQ